MCLDSRDVSFAQKWKNDSRQMMQQMFHIQPIRVLSGANVFQPIRDVVDGQMDLCNLTLNDIALAGSKSTLR